MIPADCVVISVCKVVLVCGGQVSFRSFTPVAHHLSSDLSRDGEAEPTEGPTGNFKPCARWGRSEQKTKLILLQRKDLDLKTLRMQCVAGGASAQSAVISDHPCLHQRVW